VRFTSKLFIISILFILFAIPCGVAHSQIQSVWYVTFDPGIGDYTVAKPSISAFIWFNVTELGSGVDTLTYYPLTFRLDGKTIYYWEPNLESVTSGYGATLKRYFNQSYPQVMDSLRLDIELANDLSWGAHEWNAKLGYFGFPWFSREETFYVDSVWIAPPEAESLTVVPKRGGYTCSSPRFEVAFSSLPGYQLIDTTVKFTLYAPSETLDIYNGTRDTAVLDGYYARLDIAQSKLFIQVDDEQTLLDSGQYSYEVSAKAISSTLPLIVYSKGDTFSVGNLTTPKEITLQSFSYVGLEPEFYYAIGGLGAPLDTTSIYLDLFYVTFDYDTIGDSTIEKRNYLKTIYPYQMSKFGTDTVKVVTNVELIDLATMDVLVCGQADRYAHQDYKNFIPYTLRMGYMDTVSNKREPAYKRFIVDGVSPQITMLDSTDKAWKFYISDAGSGVNNNSVVVTQNGQKVTSNSIVQYDANTHILTYYPLSLGALFVLQVEDEVKNKSSYSTYVESGRLIVYDVHSYPNPFNPVKGEKATIVLESNGLSNAEISAKICDLAGKHVATLEQNADSKLFWNGRTDGGELVANGVYMCYVSIKNLSDLTVQNYLLKIAVVKKN
jgi:hypothetical protein